MLKLLLGPIAELAGGFLKNKADQAKAKHEAKMADASANSWKDEFFSLILSLPLFFIGYAIVVDDMTIINRVEQAFAALNNLPDWYQYLLFIAVSASFGIKGADKIMKMRK
ncbi:MAG: hypothetical protein CMJ25_24405 [Phycisphaerae bacterium]|nr:hypothetical protein [Phycisphaerae bacterium]